MYWFQKDKLFKRGLETEWSSMDNQRFLLWRRMAG